MENLPESNRELPLEELEAFRFPVAERMPRFTRHVAVLCHEAEELDYMVFHTDSEIWALDYINMIEANMKDDEYCMAWAVLGIDRDDPKLIDHCYSVHIDFLELHQPGGLFGYSYDKLRSFQTYLGL